MKKYKFEEKHYFNINHTKIKILHRFRFRIINENKKKEILVESVKFYPDMAEDIPQ